MSPPVPSEKPLHSKFDSGLPTPPLSIHPKPLPVVSVSGTVSPSGHTVSPPPTYSTPTRLGLEIPDPPDNSTH